MSEIRAQTEAAALALRGVAVGALKHPASIVVADVNWTVHAGEYWVVGAPQHSGKTDFLMTVAGIMSPAAGEYWFFGERMPIFDEARLPQRLKLGLVFDGGQLLGHLTLRENIALPLRYHATPGAGELDLRVDQLLEATELTAWANSTPANVGRSWRQRAGLARALALQPQVLLLDSPLTGLDVRHTLWWLNFLDELSRGHKVTRGQPLTLVATADDLRPWRRHARQVACLAERRLTVYGAWESAAAATDQTLRELLHE